MSKWTKNKVDSSNINNGDEFVNGDNLAVNEINAIVNNSLYASAIAESVSNQISNLAPNEKIEFKGSNPNLLINGDFRVNQRGKTTYTFETDTAPYLRHYTVDRWRFVPQVANSLSTVTKNKDSISIYFSNTYDNISQFIENFENLSNKTVTASINIKTLTGGIYALRVSVDGSQVGYKNITDTGISYFTLTLPTITSSLQVALISNSNSPQTIEVEYIKLEIGSVATALSPRPYAEELAMCQRYYIKRNSQYPYGSFGNFLARSGWDYGYFYLYSPIELRTRPTLNYGGNFRAYGALSSQPITSISIDQTSDLVTGVRFNVATAYSTGECGEISANNDNTAFIELDAEIY